MTSAKMSFAKNASDEWANWNCKAMYPRPKEVDLGLPKWLGGITSAAKKGFAIYNKVKDLLPGGTKAGAGPLPGSTLEMEEELIELFGFKDVEGIGKSLKDELDKNDAEIEDSMTRRLEIWQ